MTGDLLYPMPLPFKEPSNRHEARQNAIAMAKDRQFDASLAWAAIAEVFPKDPQVEDNTDWAAWARREVTMGAPGADQTAVIQRGAGSTAVANPSGHTRPGTTIVVEAALYDVLRTLAVRYMVGAVQTVAIDIRDGEVHTPQWYLKITRMPGSAVAHCSVEPVA